MPAWPLQLIARDACSWLLREVSPRPESFPSPGADTCPDFPRNKACGSGGPRRSGRLSHLEIRPTARVYHRQQGFRLLASQHRSWPSAEGHSVAHRKLFYRGNRRTSCRQEDRDPKVPQPQRRITVDSALKKSARTMGSCLPSTRGTPLAGQDSRLGFRAAQPGRSAARPARLQSPVTIRIQNPGKSGLIVELVRSAFSSLVRWSCSSVPMTGKLGVGCFQLDSSGVGYMDVVSRMQDVYSAGKSG